MAMTDPLSDMLTRIRNGQQARLMNVNAPFSKLKAGVLDVLKDEGYIRGYTRVDNAEGKPELKIELRYVEGKGVIREISRVSKPGRREYTKVKELGRYYNGLGILILSTSKGVMSDHQATQANVAGEVLCMVF